MACRHFKDLTRVTASDKTLHDQTFSIAKISKYDRYHGGTASIGYKYFDNKTSDSGIKNGNISTKELAKELQKKIWQKI